MTTEYEIYTASVMGNKLTEAEFNSLDATFDECLVKFDQLSKQPCLREGQQRVLRMYNEYFRLNHDTIVRLRTTQV